MPDPAYIHLRLHSEYSIVDGIVRIDEAVEAVRADRMPALALTDLSNFFGLIKFYSTAWAKGIKPILGCDTWVSPAQGDRPTRMLLLVQHREGYLRLCRLLTRAWRENQHHGRAVIDRSWLAETGTEGLIALSGAHQGDVGQALLQAAGAPAKRLTEEWARLFPDRFYIELQRAGSEEAEHYVRLALPLAAETGLPVVATHPVQFLVKDDFRAHEARVCIAGGAVLADRRRPREFTPEQYLKTQAEMQALFADIPEALANSVEIAKRCNLVLELGRAQLPLFPTPPGVSLDRHLRHEAETGLEGCLRQLYPDTVSREEARPAYQTRLEHELATIIQMGFAGYFLIVADFINWAKNNGVPVGPGRGSGAGSLVAYSLGITDLDPLRYGLLFERFLNPERVSMPDFDVDFCQDGRDRVIDYVKQKYGADSVSQIVTFGTLAAKAVVRDVGRVLDMPYNYVDGLAKLIPFELNMTLAKAREQEPQINQRIEEEEDVAQLFQLAERLEGLTRNVGMHAGGVLIAPGRLTDFCPLYQAEGSTSAVSQFDKDDVEKAGLVKFDFLGLRTLTILDWAVRYVRLLHPEVDLDLATLPLDDRAVYDLFTAANTTAVFQFESRGMKDLLRQARPDRFEDLIALVALYRPGPMDLIPDFNRRKHGLERVEYLDPRLEPILGTTYGIMVYQEQVMQIAQVLGGYSLGAADLLRRAMGKKKLEEMAEHREIFVKGAVERGVPEKKAEHLFDLMEKFAGYGFNKSHAAAYALVAYQTAWLKVHHPAAFIAATLSSDMDDTDKVHNFHEDAVANGLAILPPDINTGGYRFEPVSDKEIRYGLGAVKGTGESAIGEILHARGSGPFSDLFDFCRRVDRRIVNRRVVEALIRAGAFDSLIGSEAEDRAGRRASLLASVGAALEAADRLAASSHQDSLFGDAVSQTVSHVLVSVPDWSRKEQLAQEKQALGFYFSGHPFSAYAKEIHGMVRKPLAQIAPSSEPQPLAGIIASVRTQMTRRGKMAFVLLDDNTARVEVAVFNELFERRREWLKEDALLLVQGKVSDDAYTGGMRVIAEEVMNLEAARTRFAREMRLSCNGGSEAPRLKSMLSPYRSEEGCPIRLAYVNGKALCEIALGDAWRVRLDEPLLNALRDWLSPEKVEIRYQ